MASIAQKKKTDPSHLSEEARTHRSEAVKRAWKTRKASRDDRTPK
jgi:hypothetical protein